jgi:hypothetical protein
MVFKLGIIILLAFTGIRVNSQHLIGLSRKEVVSAMKETSFMIDRSSRNTTFNYLKYVDQSGDKTFLVFFSEGDVCTSTRLMCDYSAYKTMISRFNKDYRRKSATEWTYELAGITYKVKLKKEEWFFSVVVTTKTK